MSFQEAIQYRTELHRLAELSGEEIKTAQYIQNKLEDMGFAVRSGVGGHGLIVDINSGNEGPVVMLRADIDALPYSDPNDPEKIQAIHACGHDAHAAILLAAAPKIRSSLKKGTVRLVFQPAEESLQGALAMIKDGALEGVDIAVGSHIRPVQDLPFGKSTMLPAQRLKFELTENRLTPQDRTSVSTRSKPPLSTLPLSVSSRSIRTSHGQLNRHRSSLKSEQPILFRVL